jgi:hypothetical protein
MIVGRGVVRKFGNLISVAEKQTLGAMAEGRIEMETAVTDHFLTQVEQSFREHGQTEHIAFKAWFLSDRGPKSTEHEFGADFCGVLNVRLPEFTHTKGFLSQAKISGRGLRIEPSQRGLSPVTVSDDKESRRLRNQIDKMLSVTHESFVIIYGADGFVVVPATSVKSLHGTGPIYAKPVQGFFKEYLMCFIGDPTLRAGDAASLEELRRRTESRTAIMFELAKMD